MMKITRVMYFARTVTFLVLTVAVSFFSTYRAKAAILAQYNFTGSSDAPSTVDANVSASNFSAGSGLSGGNGFSTAGGNPVPSRYSTGTATGSSLDPNDYFSFTVTADSGFTFNLDGFALTFDWQVNGSGPDTGSYAVRTSVLGFGTTVGTATMGDATSFSAATTTFSGSSYDNLSSVEVRIFMWDTSNPTSLRFDNVTLNGEVIPSPIPEPMNLALLTFATGFVCVSLGRRLLRAKLT